MINEHILQALTSYIENPDPRYALMLKGKWGCGKTWLVNKWIDDTFEKTDDKAKAILNPIRVTLYGMTSTDDITKAIDRQLHPFLYSKAAKIGKGILKIAGKVVLRTDFDFDNNGSNDATLSTSLDSLAFLASKDKEIRSDSTWLLVFDDLERSHIPVKQLLGYINYFVEYCSCHVIIIGDETKVTDDEDKKILQDFKEKTVGKEFEVEPDIDAAIANFINEIPQLVWLDEQKGLIKKVFIASQCDNLRILRQCLYDFKLQYNDADFELLKNDTHIMRELLGSFLAVYCEYKGQGRKVIIDLGSGLWGRFLFKEDSPEKKAAADLEKKYDSDRLEGINVLNHNHVAGIIRHIEKGVSLKSYIDGLLKTDQTAARVIDRLSKFREMEDDVFENDCMELSQELLDGKYRQFYPIGRALALLSLFEKELLYQVDDAVIEAAKSTMKDLFANAVNDTEVLYQCRTAFWQGMNTVENRNDEYRIHNEIASFFNDAFQNREKELPDKMQLTLNTLNDDNVKQLIVIDASSTPNRHSTYSLTPVLKGQDADMLMERIKGLSNANIRIFALFLTHHFSFGFQLDDSHLAYYKDDKDVVESMKQLTEKEIEISTGLRKYTFQYLAKVLGGCLQRCEGERGGLTECM